MKAGRTGKSRVVHGLHDRPQMHLADFIKGNMERLLEEWEGFARSLGATSGMSREELRNWAEEMLTAIAEEIATQQSQDEQARKSRGRAPEHGPELSRSARAHASERLAQGFNLKQIVSEFRALRGSVIRLWTEQRQAADRDQLEELVRFGEAIDQALTESIARFSSQLDDTRDLFVAALGHDLRSPLAAVLSSAEFLLLNADRLEDQQSNAVLRLHNSANRMRRMIDTLLDFSRTRLGGQLPLNRSSVDLTDLCRHMTQELQSYAPQRRIRLEVSGDLHGRWDRARIEEVLSNLLSNALRYGAEGAPVTVTARDQDQEVLLSVHNEGEPLSLEMQRIIFEPLVRESLTRKLNRRREGGMGIGLYIVRRIVEAHGGRIELESGEAIGTTFTVRLPRQASSHT